MALKFKFLGQPFPEMKIWGATSNLYTFAISHDLVKDDPEFSGFNASWKHASQPSHAAFKIDGGPWQTFGEAEIACKKTLRNLIRKQ